MQADDGKGGFMVRFRRQKATADPAGETGIASGLADFLVQATEGRALQQAIDAGMLAPRETADATNAKGGPPQAPRLAPLIQPARSGWGRANSGMVRRGFGLP